MPGARKIGGLNGQATIIRDSLAYLSISRCIAATLTNLRDLEPQIPRLSAAARSEALRAVRSDLTIDTLFALATAPPHLQRITIAAAHARELQDRLARARPAVTVTESH